MHSKFNKKRHLIGFFLILSGFQESKEEEEIKNGLNSQMNDEFFMIFLKLFFLIKSDVCST